MTDCTKFESHGSFAIDYIHSAVDALQNADSKNAQQSLQWAQEKLADMITELGPVRG